MNATKLPVGALLGIVVLALVGLGMIILAIASAMSGGLVGAPPTATTSALAPIPTQVVIIPTTTPAPEMSPTPSAAPATATSDAPEPTATAQWKISIEYPGYVRSGPGTTYAVVGGINPGESATLIGRDDTATWFVIAFPAATDGKGWVSNIVASVEGDIQALPILQPSGPPPAVTAAPRNPTATNAPAQQPTATPQAYSSRGIVGQAFWFETTSAGVGQEVWFHFKVTNTSNSDVPFGLLAAHTDVGPTARSWGNTSLSAGQTLEWRDNIKFSAAGTYQVYLGICYGNDNACAAGQSPWDRLSPSVTVTIN
jgi:hypothetical protein